MFTVLNQIKKDWTGRMVMQAVVYPSKAELSKELDLLSQQEALVKIEDIKNLREELVEVEEGKKQILQIGDCGECFAEGDEENVKRRASFFRTAAKLVSSLSNKDTVLIGRIAGQYAKPRSSPVEKVNGVEYTSFKGEIVNSRSLDEREPDPKRLMKAYELSKKAV